MHCPQIAPKPKAHDDFEGVEQIAKRMNILLPNSPGRVYWDSTILLLVLYSLLNTPLQLCFSEFNDLPTFLSAFNAFVDFCFILDVMLSFRTAFYEQKMLSPVLDHRKIARHYVLGENGRGGWFWPDLIAAIPFDWLPDQSVRNSAWLNFMKLGRLFRLSRVVKAFNQLTSAHVVRVGNFLVLLLLCTHAMACLWWRVGWGISNNRGWQFDDRAAKVLLEVDELEHDTACLDYSSAQDNIVCNSTQLRERINMVPLYKKYLTSLYWALTMVMKSPWLPPSIAGEQFYASCTVVIGAMLFAAFIGSFTNAIATYDKSNALYRDAMTKLNGFCKLRPALSEESHKRILRYADAYFKQTIEGVDEQSIISTLPEHVRPTILLELHSDLVRSCGWLRQTSFACCCDLLGALKAEVVLAGDTLMRAGVLSDQFYVLQSGELKVSFPPDGNHVSKLSLILGEGRAAIAKGSMMQRNSTRIPQGRIDRIGSLIGWSAPYGEQRPLAYQVRATIDSSLLSIRRIQVAELLNKHPHDVPVFKAAVEHATKLLNPVKRGVALPVANASLAASNDRRSSVASTSETADNSFSSSGSVMDNVELRADRRCSTSDIMARACSSGECSRSSSTVVKRRVCSTGSLGESVKHRESQQGDAFRDTVSSGWSNPAPTTYSTTTTSGRISNSDDGRFGPEVSVCSLLTDVAAEVREAKETISKLEKVVHQLAGESIELRPVVDDQVHKGGRFAW